MKVKKASQVEWKAFTEQCKSATFFHTLDWYLVWKTYEGYELETLLFEFKSGHQVLLPLASLKQTKGLTKFYMSSPAGTYGGFLTKNKLLEEEKWQLRKYLKRIKWINIRENPLSKNQECINWNKDDFTQIISLKKTMEEMVKTWTQSHQRSLKKGLKEEVKICEANTVKDWENYYQVYLESLKRWGKAATSRYEWKLFAILQKLPSSTCRLWLSKYEGKIIGGCLCFYHSQHVVYWHGATLSDGFHLRTNHLLHYNIMQHALQRNFLYYDFNPSGGHQGVVRFKNGFNAMAYSAKIYNKQSFLIQSIIKFKQLIP